MDFFGVCSLFNGELYDCTELNILDFQFLPVGIGFLQKVRAKCKSRLNGSSHSTDKGLLCTEMKKKT